MPRGKRDENNNGPFSRCISYDVNIGIPERNSINKYVNKVKFVYPSLNQKGYIVGEKEFRTDASGRFLTNCYGLIKTDEHGNGKPLTNFENAVENVKKVSARMKERLMKYKKNKEASGNTHASASSDNEQKKSYRSSKEIDDKIAAKNEKLKAAGKNTKIVAHKHKHKRRKQVEAPPVTSRKYRRRRY